MGDVTVNVKGLSELESALEKYSKEDVKDAIKEALGAGASLIQSRMFQEAPKDTGFLRRHFNTRFSIKAASATGSAFIGPQGHVDYPFAGGTYARKTNKRGRKYKSGRVPVITVARFLEFGTAKMAANPFITRAFESCKSLAVSRVIDALRRRLRLS